MVKLSEAVLHILALGLPGAMNPTFFKEFCTNASANLRLLHYPPQSTTDERQLGGESRPTRLIPSSTTVIRD